MRQSSNREGKSYLYLLPTAGEEFHSHIFFLLASSSDYFFMCKFLVLRLRALSLAVDCVFGVAWLRFSISAGAVRGILSPSVASSVALRSGCMISVGAVATPRSASLRSKQTMLPVLCVYTI
ncbi:hypothetical protein KC19_VG123200 [Ceratodon purpureus]|uniref:Uncharacterized protein n=1 Tax=Ceratodon purpureus TaxID=3225 RepID=A0A8T0HQB9_CERPU|nr:hypothetical protein KC19_VG123200 [Ceratodon purpureus]